MCLYGDELYHAQVKIKFMLCYVMIISKSVMIIIFVEFLNQLIDYPINCASRSNVGKKALMPYANSGQMSVHIRAV